MRDITIVRSKDEIEDDGYYIRIPESIRNKANIRKGDRLKLDILSTLIVVQIITNDEAYEIIKEQINGDDINV